MVGTKDPTRVLLIDDVARLLRCSPSTIKRRIRARTFPIPPLRGIDKRLRWSVAAMQQYLQEYDSQSSRRRG